MTAAISSSSMTMWPAASPAAWGYDVCSAPSLQAKTSATSVAPGLPPVTGQDQGQMLINLLMMAVLFGQTEESEQEKNPLLSLMMLAAGMNVLQNGTGTYGAAGWMDAAPAAGIYLDVTG